MDKITLRGVSTQDHELTGLRKTWSKTPIEIQEYILNWLDSDNAPEVKITFAGFPDAVVYFFQRAAVCGIREAVLRHAEVTQPPARCSECGVVSVDLVLVSEDAESGESDWLCSKCRGDDGNTPATEDDK